jgi:hypothetical protein
MIIAKCGVGVTRQQHKNGSTIPIAAVCEADPRAHQYSRTKSIHHGVGLAGFHSVAPRARITGTPETGPVLGRGDFLRSQCASRPAYGS